MKAWHYLYLPCSVLTGLAISNAIRTQLWWWFFLAFLFAFGLGLCLTSMWLAQNKANREHKARVAKYQAILDEAEEHMKGWKP